MSVDIAWDAITTGTDGDALAESVRAFIHAKFQQISLPRLINSVHVHSFEFGSVCPSVEIKDICDPLPDFYEDEEEDESENARLDSLASIRDQRDPHAAAGNTRLGDLDVDDLRSRVNAVQVHDRQPGAATRPLAEHRTATKVTGENLSSIGNSVFGSEARSGTPGIPGGTSNLSYFHLPFSGLSGTQTPLAAVAGGGPFATRAWLQDQQSFNLAHPSGRPRMSDLDGHTDHTQSRPRTADGVSSPELGSPFFPSSPEKRPAGYLLAKKVSDNISSPETLTHGPAPPSDGVSPSDLQVVARVTYDGDVKMLLTAEIMLDYPMPSFIKIPLKLSITGVSFDGVAILAYIKKNMHFCFLDPEDADTLVGSTFLNEDDGPSRAKKSSIASLLREMRVETEIGRQESGKQVLKNVGQVEKFVLDQVRRIFEEEFVFPSFWTFLV